MIPAQFDYLAPRTIDEAVSLLAEHQDDAKILAGGHSLIPAMKLRLAMPQILIDLGRIEGLSYIKEEGGQILIGAMTTHYQLESSDQLREICPIIPEAAAQIGDVQVRNKGTLGGSLAHADPAADWPAVMLALDASVVTIGPNGERVIKSDDLFVDMLTTSLEPNEIIREIRINRGEARAAQAYVKVPQPASGFAVVGVAVNLTLGEDGSCKSARIGVTGVGSKAYRASGVEQAITGTALDREVIESAVSHATDNVDINGDLYASADYRKHLAQVHTRRAIEAALKSKQ